MADSLEEDFHHPPPEASTWVYWVWLRTPTSPAAMTRDLEEMKAKGIVGFILYDNGAGSLEKRNAKMVAGDKAFNMVPTDEYKGEYSTDLPLLETWSPEWRKEIRHVALESKRLGLDFCLAHGLAGCSAPGLDPQYAQQELKWTSQDVTGPATFDAVLALPRDNKVLNKNHAPIYREVAVLALPVKDQVQISEVRNLSTRMDASGHLRWKAPAGQWRILRFIQRPTGASNPWGLFCDTLSTDGLDHDWALTMAPLLKEMTPAERAGLRAVEDDSWESGNPSWTRTFPEEFQKRRGYDLMAYLPALAGQTMVDAITTQRVKQDYRQTISDLIVNNYYAHMKLLCQKNGLTLYDEAVGPHPKLADFSLTGSKVDHNMAEFWMPSPHRPDPPNRFLTRDAATSNHLYGKKLTMCEAFTSLGPQWEETPFLMKACVDQAYCDGTNRTCIHNYSHSPELDAKPGDVYCAGTHINRNITWWDEVPAFFTYLARCDALLQDGDFAADALFDTGDGINSQPMKVVSPELGAGYDYDRASNAALIELASVKNGRIVTPTGMSYRVLIMPQGQGMTLEALRKISSLAQAGATIVGPRPKGLAGLPIHAGDEKQFDDLAAHLWGDKPDAASDIKVGQGRVVSGKTAQQVLQEEGVGPDFEFEGLSSQGEVAWIHRHSIGADWYYVTSRWFSPEKLTCKFRITGKRPELWDPVTGEIRDATAFQQKKGQTIVPLEFDPCGSVFVVFRKRIASTVAGTTETNYPTMQSLGNLDGEWTVAFDAKWGGPADPVIFDKLVDWTTRPEAGIKYFSGAALYTKKFDLPAAVPPGQRLILDLGEVREVASVHLNGGDLGVIWNHPARVDITSAVKPTGNHLEIKVVNLWPNRLIGDSFLPPEQQLTKTNMHHFTQASSLLPSGLLGPVQLLVAKPPAARLP